jgi:hypothetical protein
MDDAQAKANLFADSSEWLVVDSVTGENFTLKAVGGDSSEPNRLARTPSSFRHP